MSTSFLFAYRALVLHSIANLLCVAQRRLVPGRWWGKHWWNTDDHQIPLPLSSALFRQVVEFRPIWNAKKYAGGFLGAMQVVFVLTKRQEEKIFFPIVLMLILNCYASWKTSWYPEDSRWKKLKESGPLVNDWFNQYWHGPTGSSCYIS